MLRPALAGCLVLAIASTCRPQCAVFRGDDGQVRVSCASGQALTVGGVVTSGVDACLDPAGSLRVAARGTDGNAYLITWSAGGYGAQSLGGPIGDGDPGIACVPDGSLRVFVRGQDAALWEFSVDPAGAVGTSRVGGAIAGGPDVAILPGGVAVAARGADGAPLMIVSRDGAWGEWRSLGGTIQGDPAVAPVAPDRLALFVRGMDDALWTREVSVAGHGDGDYQGHGGTLAGSPDAVAGSSGILVAMAGTDGAAWMRRFEWPAAREWSSLGGAPRGDVAVVAGLPPGAAAGAARGKGRRGGKEAPDASDAPIVLGEPLVTQPVPLGEPVVTQPVPLGEPVVTQPVPLGEPVGRATIPSMPTITVNPLDLIRAPATLMNGGFESELNGWTPEGDAFTSVVEGTTQPAGRVLTGMSLENDGIGGDYWSDLPYPIGVVGEMWVASGDGQTGSLTSATFAPRAAWLHFLVAGSADPRARVEVQILEGSEWRTKWRTTAIGSEIFRREAVDLARLAGSADPAVRASKQARIRIVDEHPSGHVSADDFTLSDELPPRIEARDGGHVVYRDARTPLWGFADTHAHPANYLAFGGGLIQGKLYGPPSAALPDYLSNVNAAALGAMAPALFPLVQPFAPFLPPLDPITGAAVLGTAWPASAAGRRGFPAMVGYPKFDAGLGQQMYSDWIRRAHSGGLRLMSALAINNWLVSSHGAKNLVLGTSAPIDDRASADAQVADIKRWVDDVERREWVEIAYSPADARRIIAQGKLAIVLGVELDALGNFLPNRTWDAPEVRTLDPNPTSEAAEAQVRAALGGELDRLHAMGVRQVTAFHYVSGCFGGCAMFERLFNEQSRKFTGRNVRVVSGAPWGIRYRIDNDGWGTGAHTVREIVTGQNRTQAWDETWPATPLGHVNEMGLTRTGRILFEELARRGMIIDLDHASYRSTEELLGLAEARGYPVISSHTDFLDLGITGEGEFMHGAIDDDHEGNYRRFKTTQINNLRHEGMTTREKAQRVSRLGGTLGPLTCTFRRGAFASGSIVPNDCDGSSKTWAQQYLYAADVTGGRGVALSTDRGFINFLGPRFGPNAASMLASEEVPGLWRDERRRQVEAQGNGVRYDVPISAYHPQRFDPSGRSAFEYTGKPEEHLDAWKAIAAWQAGRNPWVDGEAGLPASRDTSHGLRIVNFLRGLTAESEEQLESDCGIGRCGGMTIAERYSGYCVGHGIDPSALRHWTNDGNVVEHYGFISRAWRQWEAMRGDNAPLKRHVFGNRDFDVNIDGVAHYGMLPDMLQDVKNSMTPEERGSQRLAPLFRSAEDFVAMWERCEAAAGR